MDWVRTSDSARTATCSQLVHLTLLCIPSQVIPHLTLLHSPLDSAHLQRFKRLPLKQGCMAGTQRYTARCK